MSIAAAIRSVLAEVATITPGVLIHADNEYRVAKSFAAGDQRAMLDAGYAPDEIDMVVVLDTHQTQDKQTLRPGDRCELDGIGYVIKSPVTNNSVFVSLPLRKIR